MQIVHVIGDWYGNHLSPLRDQAYAIQIYWGVNATIIFVNKIMQEADQDIIDLNLSWLFKARELARSNHTKAAIVLGFDETVAKRISRLSIDELRSIARSGVMLFQPRFHQKFWGEIFEDDHRTSLSIRFQTLLMAAKDASDR